jgi:hypothetical protein
VGQVSPGGVVTRSGLVTCHDEGPQSMSQCELVVALVLCSALTLLLSTLVVLPSSSCPSHGWRSATVTALAVLVWCEALQRQP